MSSDVTKDGILIVRGLSELKETYRTLPDKLKRGVLKRGVSAMARTVAKEVRRLAPQRTGLMKRNVILVRARSLQSATQIGMLVTIRRGKKYQSVGKNKVNKDAFYWPWVERGHRIVPRRAGKHVGITQHRRDVERGKFGRVRRVAAVAFMQTALEASAGTAVDAMQRSMKHDLSFPKVPS